jgi:hypothetical protein
VGEPVLMRWDGNCVARVEADAFQVVEYRHRLVFAQPLPGAPAREAYVKGFLDRQLPVPEGHRRGPAAVTWDLTGRVLDVSFVDREGR